MWCRNMKGINLISKQRGTFSVEFSIIGLIFGILLMFSADVIIKLSVKGKLDRLSYSLVSIAKERTQLYAEEDYTLESSDVSLLHDVAVNSLTRTIGAFDSSSFSMLVEEITTSGGYQTHSSFAGSCGAALIESTLANLKVETSWGRDSSVYRVTLCYETDNLVAGVLGGGFTTVQSSSAMIGR